LFGGSHSASPCNFSGNHLTLTAVDAVVAVIVPTFYALTPWVSLDNSNVSVNNMVMQHTYNYADWQGLLSQSFPLVVVGDNSNAVFINVTFIPSGPSVIYANPIVFGNGSSSTIDIRYTTFINFSFTRVSLIHSFKDPKFYITNSTFRYGEVIFLLFYFFLSNISCGDFDFGTIYSSDSFEFNYHFDFQNCTFEGIVSNATTGGAISIYAVMTNLSISSCSFLDITTQSIRINGGYIFISENPGEIHITGSVFSNAAVFSSLFFSSMYLFLFLFILFYFILFFFFETKGGFLFYFILFFFFLTGDEWWGSLLRGFRILRHNRCFQ
jgi:hypothetical protein